MGLNMKNYLNKHFAKRVEFNFVQIVTDFETNDASKCLADGRAVTNCANKFFREVSSTWK